MSKFTDVYDKSEVNIATQNVKKALLAYVLFALLFVAFCALFVILYAVVEFNVYVCFAVNFLATVAFVWYTVAFFSVTFPEKRDGLRFYRVVDNAQLTALRGEYLQGGETVKEGRLFFTSVEFLTADGKVTLLLRQHVSKNFREHVTYDLQTVGNKLMSYKEFSDD